MDEDRFGFSGKKPTPADKAALEFADKLTEMALTRRALGQAMANVPSYTAQWEPPDYYAEEEEAYNRAVDDLWQFMKENFND